MLTVNARIRLRRHLCGRLCPGLKAVNLLSATLKMQTSHIALHAPVILYLLFRISWQFMIRDCTMNYLAKKANAMLLHLAKKYVRICVRWYSLFREENSSQECSYKFKLLRCKIPLKNIAIVSFEEDISPRTNIRAYFSASFKCFS